MITPSELKGVMAMMPAFTTPDGGSPNAKQTINTTELERAVDQIIRDGIDVITTMGSFGECHTLLRSEKRTLAEATIAAVKKRVPVFIGCTTLNTRETMEEVEFAERVGADGVLCGVPFYFPSTADNAVQFYLDLADAFPRLGIAIYHNPQLHRITIPVAAFHKLTTRPNIVGMKDSHRQPIAFMELMNITRGKMSVFCNQSQCYPYMQFGAAGCWSIQAWLGPWPLLRLRDACCAGDWDTAKQICLDLNAAYKAPGNPGELFWRENAHKLSMNEAGYCMPGPLRPPFRVVPQEIYDAAKSTAAKWRQLCEKWPYHKAAA
jgi:hydratase-aldolase